MPGVFRISVQEAAFDIAAILADLRAGRSDIGAIVTFSGLMRDFNAGDTVTSMTLEHYPAMSKRELARIATQAEQSWSILAGSIIHRVGTFIPGDDIVCVAVASAHRQDAFEAAAFLMDWLKTQAPFWKLEQRRSGTAWVEQRDSDAQAAARWQIHPTDKTK